MIEPEPSYPHGGDEPTEPTELQRATHRKVLEYVGELFEDPFHDRETGHVYVRYGSTVLEIYVEPYGPEEAMVGVVSYCVQGLEVDEELMSALLDLNHRLPFGAFSLVGDDVFFAHSLFGRTLDRKNLLGSIAAVATIADDYDDRIVARWGGQTALDRIQDTGGRDRRVERLEAE